MNEQRTPQNNLAVDLSTQVTVEKITESSRDGGLYEVTVEMTENADGSGSVREVKRQAVTNYIREKVNGEVYETPTAVVDITADNEDA